MYFAYPCFKRRKLAKAIEDELYDPYMYHRLKSKWVHLTFYLNTTAVSVLQLYLKSLSIFMFLWASFANQTYNVIGAFVSSLPVKTNFSCFRFIVRKSLKRLVTLVNVKVLELVATNWCSLNYALE